MSLLSKFESTLSCIGFMFGAPSISSPWPSRRASAANPAETTEGVAALNATERLQLHPMEDHLDDLHSGLGMETAGCRDNAPPGSGQLDSYGELA